MFCVRKHYSKKSAKVEMSDEKYSLAKHQN